ncbi:MAG: hypothetical protein LC745_08705 [Planctomycetia bacterium]|nr:hypothetical protein [Planctomycetia bacterium]
MTDRADRVRRPAARPRVTPGEGRESGFIVVPYRPGRQSAKLLPPILVVMLGTAFLAYRARVSDWRGLSSLFEPRPGMAAAASVVPPVAQMADVPAVVVTAPRPEPAPTAGKAEPKPEPRPAAGNAADPLDDIRREAEATRERIVGLENLKEQEARKLDEAAARPRDDRRNRKFGVRPVPLEPIEIDRMIRVREEQTRRQIAEFQRRESDLIAAMERDFFNARGRMRTPPPPPPLPIRDFPVEPGRVRRPPAGAVARFRVSRGPNGLRLERYPGGPADADIPPPPPRPWRGE